MKDTELKKTRDEDLYNAYLQGLREGKFTTLREAADYICIHPAPQFYISARAASLYVGMFQSHINPTGMPSCSYRRIKQLYRNYLAFREAHPDCTLSRERIMEILVDEPAPEFYITPEFARKIIQYKAQQQADETISKFSK